MKSNLHSLFVFCLVVMIPLRMVSQATCPVPTNPTTTNIGNHNATLSWTAPAGTVASVVQYRPVTTPESQWINVTSQTSSFTLTNLACGTNYQWHVASICTNGTTVPGTYSPVVGFATTACNTACVAPTNPHAININPTGATLSWTPVTGALSYIVQYRLIISAGAAWTTVNTQNASLTLTNLICGAAYEWHVATVCGTAAGNISPYSATVDFVTAACTTNCPAPTGLTSSISGAATVLTWTGTTGALAYIIQYRPVTNPESAWINITTQNPATSFTLTNLLCGKVYQWHVKAICNTSSNNGTSPYSAMAYFTTAACAPPTCIAPSAPATTNITGSGATLSWNAPAGAISYVVQYRPITTPESAWITVTTQSTSFNLTGLTCGKHYQWHVAAHCNNGSTAISPYSATADFTTVACAPNCVAPSGLTTTTVTGNSAILSWIAAAGSLSYVVQYRPITTPESPWITITAQSMPLTLTGLVCGKNYQWHVAAHCANNTTTISPYSAMAYFTTTACTTNCAVPTNLHATNTNPNGATLSWTGPVGALGYIVQYQLAASGGAAWISVNTQSASLTLTNLICGSAYIWRVATICGTTVNGTSAFSATADFVTLACTPPTCVAPSGLTTTNINANGATLSWIAPGNAYAYIIQYRPVTNPESAWINVTTQNPATSFTLTNLHCATSYQWHIAAYCNTSSGAIGPYSAMAYFTTAPCTTSCAAPTGLLSSTIPAIPGVVLSWTGSAGLLTYILQYRPLTTPASPWITVTTQSTTFTIMAALGCATNYQWHVQAVCNTSSNSGTSPYSAMAYFTTLPCTSPVCNAPTALTSTAINTSSTSRMLTWSATGAPAYNIRYRIISAATWLTTTSTTNSKLINGLQLGSHYEWQVQSVCTGNGTSNTSPWSQSADFDTPISRPVFPNPASGSSIQIPFITENETRIHITISDRMGKVTRTIDKTIPIGGETIDIDIASLDAGMYFINIRNGSKNEIQKLFITR